MVASHEPRAKVSVEPVAEARARVPRAASCRVAAAIVLLTFFATDPSLSAIDNGGFTAGLDGWTAVTSDPANRITVVPRPAADIPFAARMLVNRVAAKPPVWHVNLVLKNRGLDRLQPATAYVLRFRARASSPRALRLALAQEYRPYRNLGLRRDVQLDRAWRAYSVSFRTDATIPMPREPDASGPWLSFLADTVPGETWLTAIRIDPQTIARRRPGSSGLLSTFLPGDAWQGTGRMRAPSTPATETGIRMTLPSNSVRFIERELPVELPDDDWKLALRVWIDAPENIGRLSLLARSGEGIDYAMASVSGLERGWNQIALTRRQFTSHWFSRVRWDSVQTFAMRIETNANGPLTIEPTALSLGGEATRRPQVTRLTVEHAAQVVTIVCDTDVRARASLAWGASTSYGVSRRSAAPGMRHTFVLRGLTPHRRYHARIVLKSTSGAPGSSGDFVFSTASAGPAAATASVRPSRGTRAIADPVPRAGFDIGLFGVTTPDDVMTTGRTAFSGVQSYQLSSISNNSSADARRYLDAAAAAGLRVQVGFDAARVLAGDLEYVRARVRALHTHPAVGGWYVFDEPEMHGVEPRVLVAVRDAIRAEDRVHPITIAASWLGADYPYRGGFDVAILDKYPIPYSGPAAIIPALERARRSGERWQFAFQAYATDLDHRWPSSDPGPGRYPTRDEMRAMAYLALNHGAQGLWAFSFDYLHHTPGSEWKWVELTELARELRGLEQVWGSGETPALSVSGESDAALDAGVRRLGAAHYVTIVNSSGRTVKGSVALNDLPDAAVITRVDADAPFEAAGELAGSRLTATWRPYAAHVYAIARARR